MFGAACKFSHEPEAEPPDISPTTNLVVNSNRNTGGQGHVDLSEQTQSTKTKSMQEEQLARSHVPCIYYAKGFCREGNGCHFSHAMVATDLDNPHVQDDDVDVRIKVV